TRRPSVCETRNPRAAKCKSWSSAVAGFVSESRVRGPGEPLNRVGAQTFASKREEWSFRFDERQTGVDWIYDLSSSLLLQTSMRDACDGGVWRIRVVRLDDNVSEAQALRGAGATARMPEWSSRGFYRDISSCGGLSLSSGFRPRFGLHASASALPLA